MTGPTTTRQDFLDSADVVLTLLADPALPTHWLQPAILPGFTIGGLAAHLGRAVLQVARYLDAEAPLPSVAAVSAAGYFAAATGIDDRDSELSRSVIARGEAGADGGIQALRDEVGATVTRLRERLPTEPGDRRVAPLGVPMLLDEYLLTRLVEIVVHVDDLALSLGIGPPPLPDDVTNRAIAVLIETATIRHGGPAVLRALTRRERDEVGALRVF